MKSSSLYSGLLAGGLTCAALLSPAAAAQAPATFTIKSLTPETALKAAQAALRKCRDDGFQVAVAVVDRSGLSQVMLRDRYAGPHTPRTAAGKAWTAVSFRTNTSDLVAETQAGKPSSGIRNLPRVTIVAGGVMIEAGGNLLGAIGVSGAPGGAADEVCARAGIKAIADDIEF
jgi:uncharacterized protein GlcG (DUF336 family)